MALSITRWPRYALIGLVRAYQYVLAPHLPRTCRYTPSCSVYAVEALKRYGAVKGSILTAHRILRCNPWGGHGHDPPRWYGEPRPPKIKKLTAEEFTPPWRG